VYMVGIHFLVYAGMYMVGIHLLVYAPLLHTLGIPTILLHMPGTTSVHRLLVLSA